MAAEEMVEENEEDQKQRKRGPLYSCLEFCNSRTHPFRTLGAILIYKNWGVVARRVAGNLSVGVGAT